MLRLRSCASSTMIVSYFDSQRSVWISASRMPSVMNLIAVVLADRVVEAHLEADRAAQLAPAVLPPPAAPPNAPRSAAAGCSRSCRRRRDRRAGRSSAIAWSCRCRSRRPPPRPGGGGSARRCARLLRRSAGSRPRWQPAVRGHGARGRRRTPAASPRRPRAGRRRRASHSTSTTARAGAHGRGSTQRRWRGVPVPGTGWMRAWNRARGTPLIGCSANFHDPGTPGAAIVAATPPTTPLQGFAMSKKTQSQKAEKASEKAGKSAKTAANPPSPQKPPRPLRSPRWRPTPTARRASTSALPRPTAPRSRMAWRASCPMPSPST